jgi:hypothetical protein
MRRAVHRAVVVVLTTLALAALAGCGGPGGQAASADAGNATATTGQAAGGGSASRSATLRSYQQKALPIARQFAQCARRNGKPSFPDPILTEDGYVDFPESAKSDYEDLVVNQSSPCRRIMRQLFAVVAPPPAEPPSPELFAARQQYARCLRAHGLPDTPDPRRDGSPELTGDAAFAASFGPVDPQTVQRINSARDACRQQEDALREADRREAGR